MNSKFNHGEFLQESCSGGHCTTPGPCFTGRKTWESCTTRSNSISLAALTHFHIPCPQRLSGRHSHLQAYSMNSVIPLPPATHTTSHFCHRYNVTRNVLTFPCCRLSSLQIYKTLRRLYLSISNTFSLFSPNPSILSHATQDGPHHSLPQGPAKYFLIPRHHSFTRHIFRKTSAFPTHKFASYSRYPWATTHLF